MIVTQLTSGTGAIVPQVQIELEQREGGAQQALDAEKRRQALLEVENGVPVFAAGWSLLVALVACRAEQVAGQTL